MHARTHSTSGIMDACTGKLEEEEEEEGREGDLGFLQSRARSIGRLYSRPGGISRISLSLSLSLRGEGLGKSAKLRDETTLRDYIF